MTILHQCFKFDGGIGSYLAYKNELGEKNKSSYFPTNFKRFAYDNLFMIIMMIVMIDVVSGIIIDTFGSLREEADQLKKDVKNFCFICGQDRESLDKLRIGKSGFTEHIKKEHYMWNYLFYIAYIKDKSETELTGLESYVKAKIEKEDISWFPCDRSLSLERRLLDSSNPTDTGDENPEIIDPSDYLKNINDKVRFFITSNNYSANLARQFDYRHQLDAERAKNDATQSVGKPWRITLLIYYLLFTQLLNLRQSNS